MNADLGFGEHWALNANVTYLNHGAYGACPRTVLARQTELRAQLEANPTHFFIRELAPLLHEARSAVAALVRAPADDLAFTVNPTHAVSTILRSLTFAPGDELLTTSHAYVSCRNALEYVAASTGARVVIADVPYPSAGPAEVVEHVLGCVTARTRLALLDHVTSPTALIFPIEQLVAALETRGVPTLVDGAHAPGQLPVDVGALSPAYYVGHCHKWLCAPKGATFFYARPALQSGLVPLAIPVSYAANSNDALQFRQRFDAVGSIDPSALLCIPAAVQFLDSLVPGGLPALQARNHALAVRARTKLASVLDVPLPCPDAMIGSMFTLPLPDGSAEQLRNRLYREHNIEVAVIAWPAAPRRLLRVSIQAYNTWEHIERLAGALREALGA